LAGKYGGKIAQEKLNRADPGDVGKDWSMRMSVSQMVWNCPYVLRMPRTSKKMSHEQATCSHAARPASGGGPGDIGDGFCFTAFASRAVPFSSACCGRVCFSDVIEVIDSSEWFERFWMSSSAEMISVTLLIDVF